MTHFRIQSLHFVRLLVGAALALIAYGNAAPSAAAGAAIQSAITSPDRFAGDSEQDARRKPQAVLEFMGVKPGMRVLDYFAGAGYYSELLSRITGPGGSVTVYNSPIYAKFAGEKLAQRFANNRLANAKVVTLETDALQLQPNSLDGALFVIAYHDLYLTPKDAAAKPANIGQITEALFQAVKPGGVVVIADHAANPGGDTANIATTLHRIDPNVVKADFTKAGFTFDGESDALRNSADDHSKMVFDPAVRGKTDQFIYRFKKPG